MRPTPFLESEPWFRLFTPQILKTKWLRSICASGGIFVLTLRVVAGASEVCVSSAEEAFGLYEACRETLESNTASHHSRWVPLCTRSLTLFTVLHMGKKQDFQRANYPLCCLPTHCADENLDPRTHFCAVVSGMMSRLLGCPPLPSPLRRKHSNTLVLFFSLQMQLPVLRSC